MHLEVRKAGQADLEAASSIHGPNTGDLAAAACQIAWQVDPSDATATKRRAQWSLQQQSELFANDRTTRLMKVVESDNDDEIIAFGRWHNYEHGYHHHGDLEICGMKNRNDPATWPEGLNKDFYLGFLDPLFAERRKWMGEGKYWILTNIVTREPLRKHGAGSLLLRWGLEQAKKDGCPAYLEAAPDAKSLYEKHGFRQVGEQHVEVLGMKIVLARMRADP